MEDISQVKFVIQKVRTSRYVYEYKNVWDPVNKRSKPLYRIPVGKVVGEEIILNEEYLKARPNIKQGDIVLAGNKAVLNSKLITTIKEQFSFESFEGTVLYSDKLGDMVSFYRKLGAEITNYGEFIAVTIANLKLLIKPLADINEKIQKSSSVVLNFEITTSVNILVLGCRLEENGLPNELIEIKKPNGEAQRVLLLKDPDGTQIILRKTGSYNKRQK